MQEAAKGAFIRLEFEVTGKEGVPIVVNLSLKPQENEAGQVVMLICEGHNITDLKRLREELEATTQRYEYVNLATSDAIFEWDITRRALYKGIGYDRLFGARERTLKQHFISIHRDDRQRVRTTLFKAF